MGNYLFSGNLGLYTTLTNIYFIITLPLNTITLSPTLNDSFLSPGYSVLVDKHITPIPL